MSEEEKPLTREEAQARISALVRDAEAAYDKMYDVHDPRDAKWQYELAYDWLRDAAKIERELGLEEDAMAHEARAQHIRTVYRHQFMMPPDLSA
jgi:hypothetical protein